MGNDFFYQFGCTIGSICVAAAYKSSDKSLQFIAEGKLEIVTVVPRPFWIVSFRVALFE